MFIKLKLTNKKVMSVIEPPKPIEPPQLKFSADVFTITSSVYEVLKERKLI